MFGNVNPTFAATVMVLLSGLCFVTALLINRQLSRKQGMTGVKCASLQRIVCISFIITWTAITVVGILIFANTEPEMEKIGWQIAVHLFLLYTSVVYTLSKVLRTH